MVYETSAESLSHDEMVASASETMFNSIFQFTDIDGPTPRAGFTVIYSGSSASSPE